MISMIAKFIKRESKPKYTGLADFITRASSKEKKDLFIKAARGANDDQLKIFTRARLKMKAQ